MMEPPLLTVSDCFLLDAHIPSLDLVSSLPTLLQFQGDIQTELLTVEQHHRHRTSPYTQPSRPKVHWRADLFFVHCLPHPSTQN
jgi:hypothetical protein